MCSKCEITCKSIPEHIRKFHNGLNINLEMPHKFRQSWKKEDMKAAIIAVRNRTMGVKKASKCFNVPRSTLVRKARSKEENIEELITAKLGRKPTLSSQLEKILVSHCLEMRSRFYNLTSGDIKRMAFKLASINCASHPFSKNNEAAGKKWFQQFMSRHPDLKRKKRIKQCFNLENVQLFFDVFETLMATVEHIPSRLYNYDVTGVAVVKRKVNKIVYLKAKEEIGSISVGDRCSLVTLVTCTNAVGHFLPPLLIFPRKSVNSEVLDDSSDGLMVLYHKSGWIEDEVLVSWFQTFLNNVKPTKADPVILVMGCHQTYMCNVEFLELARENGVHLICLPPQSTYIMQPLEIGIMELFKSHFAKGFESWQKKNISRTITDIQIGKLLCEAFNKVATSKGAADGFKKTGLFPCDRSFFNDRAHSEVKNDDKNSEESTGPSLFDSIASRADNHHDVHDELHLSKNYEVS